MTATGDPGLQTPLTLKSPVFLISSQLSQRSGVASVLAWSLGMSQVWQFSLAVFRLTSPQWNIN